MPVLSTIDCLVCSSNATVQFVFSIDRSKCLHSVYMCRPDVGSYGWWVVTKCVLTEQIMRNQVL